MASGYKTIAAICPAGHIPGKQDHAETLYRRTQEYTSGQVKSRSVLLEKNGTPDVSCR